MKDIPAHPPYDHGSRGVRWSADWKPPRSLQQALADLNAKLKALLPLNHPGRAEIARQIVGIEDQIEMRRQQALRAQEAP